MAQNDPQWGGGRRGDGPPDLDELFRRLNQKLSRLLGGGKGNGPSGGPAVPSPSPRGIKGGAIALVGVLAALWLGSGFFVVYAREEAVVLRLGSYDRTATAGLQWHIPYPFEKVEIVNMTEVRSVEVGYRGNAKNRMPDESLMLTEDLNIVDVQLSVQYDVQDARAFLFNNVYTEPGGQGIVKSVTESAISQVVGQNKIDFVLNEGRTKIASDTQTLIQKILDLYGMGLRVIKVNINNVQPPDQVQAAFEDAVKAGQDKEKSRNEAQAYANDVVPRATGMAARLIEEAQGYSQRVVASADGEASRFKAVLGEYQKAPVVMRDRLYIDTMQQILQNTTKVLVDGKNGQNLLYLPFDKLMDINKKPSSGTASAPAAQADTPPLASEPPVRVVTPSANGRPTERAERGGRNLQGGQ